MDGATEQASVTAFRKTRIFPVLYMFVITFLLTAVLVGLSRSTQTRVEANREIRFETATLEALGLGGTDADLSGGVHALFRERVTAPTPASAGAFSLLDEQQNPTAYALPVEGQGFWDLIKGVVGIDATGTRLIGVSIHEQKETPGLGAEIVKPAFVQQFAGLPLAEGDQPLRLRPKGTDLAANEVEAVTGATQTCTRLERILNEAICAWRGKMQALRGTP